MEVEEDPSSQFVDFTNATPLEQFISDIEQTLIAWQLSNKGHASAEALSVAFPRQQPQQKPRRLSQELLHSKKSDTAQQPQQPPYAGSSDEPLTWTHVLELDQHGNGGTPSRYALTLFVSSQSDPEQQTAGTAAAGTAAAAPSSEDGGVNSKKTKWQEGLEHFTPTMLAIADTTRDFHWQLSTSSSSPGFRDSSVFVDAGHGGNGLTFEEEQVRNKRATFQSVKKWFGVEEFVFLSRTSQSANRKPTSTMNRSRPAASSDAAMDKLSADMGKQAHVSSGGGGSTKSSEHEDGEESKDFMLDIAVDQNESGLLLSALTIALNNCNCTLPAFVPTYEPSKGTWLGSAVPGATGNVSISFETDSIPEVNSNQSCISGLLDFFKLKLQLPHHIEEKYRLAAGESSEVAIGMLVSASFGYTWTRAEDPREIEMDRSVWETKWFESSSDDHASEAHQQIAKDLFGTRSAHYVGSTTSPLLGMDLTVMWPNLREGTYVDNVVHSSLDAKKAPEWMLDARFQDLKSENERKPQLALSKMVANLVQAYSNSRELSKDILVSELAPNLPPSSAPPSSSGPSSSTSSSSRLPETIPAARAAVVIGNAIGTLTSSLVSAATWKGTDIEEIRRIVWELFDDDEGSMQRKSSFVSTHVAHSAPIGQLVSILACRMGQLRKWRARSFLFLYVGCAYFGACDTSRADGVNAMSLLWVEFVKMLRERWFQLRLLPAMVRLSDVDVHVQCHLLCLFAFFLAPLQSTAIDDGGEQCAATNRSLDAFFLLDSESLQLPPPDFHQCLLHQKLQLLNCCILRHVLRISSLTVDDAKAQQLTVRICLL